jgi:hypothetical protein
MKYKTGDRVRVIRIILPEKSIKDWGWCLGLYGTYKYCNILRGKYPHCVSLETDDHMIRDVLFHDEEIAHAFIVDIQLPKELFEI